MGPNLTLFVCSFEATDTKVPYTGRSASKPSTAKTVAPLPKVLLLVSLCLAVSLFVFVLGWGG